MKRATLAARACYLAATLSVACTPALAATPSPPPTLASWRSARQRLHDLRARRDRAPRTLKIALELKEPYTGRVMEARGAVALAPAADAGSRGALRMILLGPGGTTALDLWLAGDRFRFAVPAIDLLRRGDARTPRSSMRGLPVDFLGWWLLAPFEGTLLWHAREGSRDRFVLRDGDAIVHLDVDDDGRVAAKRSSRTSASGGAARLDVETVIAGAGDCAPARYHQSSTGLDVAITCEGEERSRPPGRAFVDPDAPETDEEGE